MEAKTQDILARAFARLQGLRNNVAGLTLVEEIYVREYHEVLDKLEGIGVDTSDFRVPSSEVKPRITGFSGGETHYSSRKHVPKALLLAKLDAVIAYFQITASDKPKNIGFSAPDK
jgi:hypothetical protein